VSLRGALIALVTLGAVLCAAGCMRPSPPVARQELRSRGLEEFHQRPVILAPRRSGEVARKYAHSVRWSPRLLLAGSEEVEITIRLTDRNALPGDYRFDDRDRFEVVPHAGGKPLPLEDVRVWRGRLLGRISRVPAQQLGFSKLIIDQTARGGTRLEFDYAFRIIDRLRVALTFDDGPVPIGDPSDGRTKGSPTARVLDVLAAHRHGPERSRRGVKAVFFVLTSPEKFMGKTYLKGETADGAALMKRAAREGHLLAAHWGGKYRKQRYHHCSRVDGDNNGRDDDGDGRVDEDQAYDINGDGKPDGKCALESDLLESLARVQATTGQRPEFVRPPEWVWRLPGRPEIGKRVLATYKRLGLKMILTDAKLGDGGYAQVSVFSMEGQMLKRSLRRAVARGHCELVITMHDSNTQTAAKLKRWLRRVESILAGIKLGGRRIDPLRDVEFIDDRAALVKLLREKRCFAYPRVRPAGRGKRKLLRSTESSR
jgi:peptidoglycan/xylan/chitin deacetylase (PgdA/CDA1 family)